jgi:hypothetical protein
MNFSSSPKMWAINYISKHALILLKYMCNEKCCQGHDEPWEQKLKKKFKSNFQTKNKQHYIIQKQKHNN